MIALLTLYGSFLIPSPLRLTDVLIAGFALLGLRINISFSRYLFKFFVSSLNCGLFTISDRKLRAFGVLLPLPSLQLVLPIGMCDWKGVLDFCSSSSELSTSGKLKSLKFESYCLLTVASVSLWALVSLGEVVYLMLADYWVTAAVYVSIPDDEDCSSSFGHTTPSSSS